MGTLKLKIDTPIIAKKTGFYEISITRNQLCNNTLSPTAYLRTDGADAKSLSTTMTNYHGIDPTSISYEGFPNEKGIVKIDWSKYKMTQARQDHIIIVRGNHDVDIEIKIQILHPLTHPNLALESDTLQATWGDFEIGDIVINGTQVGGHKSWMYTYETKVFIPKTGNFYLSDFPEMNYNGEIGYMIYMNQWESKSIPIRYDYGYNSIKTRQSKKLKIRFIYYKKENNVEQDVSHEIKELKVSFAPLLPKLEVKCNKIKDAYKLGSRDAAIFDITPIKHDVRAVDLEAATLKVNDERVHISNGNNGNFIVYIETTKFKDLPTDPITIDLTCSASNAEDVTYPIILSAEPSEAANSVQLCKEYLIGIANSSDIKINSEVILYLGNGVRRQRLCIENLTIQTLGEPYIVLNNITAEICSDSDIKFSNGRKKERISALMPGGNNTFEIRFRPDEAVSETAFSINISTDYSQTLVIPVKVQTKEKEIPQISFEFIQNKELNCACNDIFTPIQYDNILIGKLLVKAESNGESYRFSEYNLIDNPVIVEGNTKISLVSNSGTDKLSPDETKSYKVRLTGSLSQDECFVVKTGENEQSIGLAVSPVYYKLPEGINFVPANDDCHFTYANTDRLFIGELIPRMPECTGEMTSTEFSLHLPDSFCFENGTNKVKVTDDECRLKVYLSCTASFNGVENILQTVTIPFSVSLTSPVLREEQFDESCSKDIIVNPIIAKAQPNVYLLCDQEGIGEEQPTIIFTEDWYEDEKHKIFDLIFCNKTSIPYSPCIEVDNDFVEFTEIQISESSDNNVLELDTPQLVRIENGQEEIKAGVFINCRKWDRATKEFEFKISFKLRTGVEGWQDGNLNTVDFKLVEARNDKIYSLDLGTTGIVMAKQDGYEISTINLKDASEADAHNIERARDIISSIAIIYNKPIVEEDNVHQVLLSPRIVDYKSKAQYIFVPAKFVVGQKRIPYINRYVEKIPCVSLDPTVTSESRSLSEDYIYTIDANRDDQYLSPEIYLQLIYENVLNRIGEDRNNIRKFILTYPNTYTQHVLDELKRIVEEKFNDLCGFIEMVPESDAVVAYYLNKRINSTTSGLNSGTERVLIYDMGAGTLDLSLLTITRDENSRFFTAEIEKKIGIPIAGNYLDWIIYSKFFYDKMKPAEENTTASQLQKNLKDYIKELKTQYTSLGLDTPIPLRGADECLKEEICRNLATSNAIKFKDIDCEVEEYIKLCSETILRVFLGDKASVDRVVFSGRGSQFGPLRENVKKYLNFFNGNLIVDTSIDGDDLKTCVAKGAIYYGDLFKGDNGGEIRNRNQYMNLGVVYLARAEDGGHNEVRYKEIIHPDDGQWDDITKAQDGTRWREFVNSINLDLSENNKVYFIQTLLSAEEVVALYSQQYENPAATKDDIKWVFINELFSFNTRTLTQSRNNIEVSVKIDKENNISYHVGGRYPRGEKLVDRIESNPFYQRGMWPYVDFK